MALSKCAVPDCKSGTKVPGHMFPKNPATSRDWVSAIGCTNLASLTSEQLRAYRVCHEHFTETDYIYSVHRRKLRHDAVPSQNMRKQSQNVVHVNVPVCNSTENNTQLFINILPESEAIVSNVYSNEMDSAVIIQNGHIHDTHNESVDALTERIMETPVEKTEVCRLCAKKSKNHVLIFGDNHYYIPEKISRCLPIIVLSNDDLPSYICKRCLHYLNISYKLIVTSVQVDTILKKQLEDSRKAEENLNIQNMHKLQNKPLRKTARNPSFKDLKRKAIAGPAECEFCNIFFEDIDAFDSHIESVHMLQWRCNQCENSFDTSAELVSHKALKHNGNVNICKTCVSCNENRKQENATIQETATHSLPEKSATDNVPNKAQFKHTDLKLQMSVVTNNTIPCSDVNICTETKNEKQQPSICKKKRSTMLFCDLCKICFGDDRHFSAHKKIHDSKRISCVSCHSECSSIYNLFLHKREAHGMYKKVQLKYVCDKCGKFFTNSWQWEAHRGNACPKKIFDNTCKYCKSAFSTNHKLMRHLRKHKTEMLNDPTVTIYKCVACPKIFVDEEFYQKHRNVHDPECWDKFKCNLCNRPFRDNVRLREHQSSIHEGIKPHQCDVCGRTFHRLYNMKVHHANHFGRKCTQCDTIFGKMRDLMKHIREDHGLEPDMKKLPSKTTYTSSTHVCRYCGKKLSSYQSLINHEHIHTGERPYSCKICHKTFRSYTSRWAHTQRHKKGNFVCEHCGKCFSYKQNLTVHVLTHLPVEDRKHQCAICGKRFLRKCHLNIHTRIHDGVRPYTCDICLFSFTQKGDMRRHRMRHLKGDIRQRGPRCKSVIVKHDEPNKSV